VSELPVGVRVEADLRAAKGWADPAGVSIGVKSPTAEARVVRADYVASGRLRATLPDDGPGLYTFVVSTPLGTQRVLHLRRNRAEDETWGTNPALETWKRAGLVASWDPGSLAQHREGSRAGHQADRWLLGLALALFLAGVLVDRMTIPRLPVFLPGRRRGVRPAA
jgi:hypothetical protein